MMLVFQHNIGTDQNVKTVCNHLCLTLCICSDVPVACKPVEGKLISLGCKHNPVAICPVCWNIIISPANLYCIFQKPASRVLLLLRQLFCICHNPVAGCTI